MDMSTIGNRIGVGLGATALVALALTGCTSTPAPEEQDATGASAQFVACLKAAGADARISDEGYVLVKVASQRLDDGSTTSVESSGPGEGALLVMGDSDGDTWVAPQSSAYFVDDPDLQDAYAGCEDEHPDFAQPESTPEDDPAVQEMLAAQLEAGLELARCARDEGFSWVADPDAESGSIALPADLGEDEFRALLAACWDAEGAGIAWSLPAAELSFDWQAVLEEFTGGIGGFSATRGAR